MTTPKIDHTPRDVQRAPFASESGLQRFIEDHAEDLLSVRVVASSRPGGKGLFNIDTLAEDRDGRPWIIECKHDLVDARALSQLRRYRAALMAGWATAGPLFGRNRTPADCPEPMLVAVGYRFDDSVVDEQLLRIVYRYQDVMFTDDELQSQRTGRVSLHNAAGVVGPEAGHPKVSKKMATTERLQSFAPGLTESFWRIDAALRELPGVKVKYGGKNFVRYSTRSGIFAEAVIGDGVVEWRAAVTRSMHSDSDTTSLLALLLEARGKSG